MSILFSIFSDQFTRNGHRMREMVVLQNNTNYSYHFHNIVGTTDVMIIAMSILFPIEYILLGS